MSVKNIKDTKFNTNVNTVSTKNKTNAYMLFLLICLMVATNSYAKAKKYTQDGCTIFWDLSKDGTLSISGNGPMPNFEIDGEKKWKTTPPWYKKGGEIVKVIIEEGVTSIGNYAFYDGLWKNNDAKGNQYNKISSFELPNSMETIGKHAFSGLGISAIKLNDGLQSIGDCAFMNTALNEITIPSSVSEMGTECFSHSSQLKRTKLSDNMASIPQKAFYNCNLEYVQFPKQLKTINNSAFQNCNLKEAMLPKTVESIGEHAFLNNNELKKIYIPLAALSIGDESFGDYQNPFNGLVLCMPDHVDCNNVLKLGISSKALQQYLKSIRDEHGDILLESKEGRTISKKVDHIDGTVFYMVEENGSKGVVDDKGRWVVPSTEGMEITRKHRMSDRMAFYEVECNGYVGIIGNDGKWIVPINQKYRNVEEVMDDNRIYYIVRKGANNEYGLLSAEGKTLLSTCYDFLEVENGFVRYKIDGYYGISDSNGNTVIPTSRGYTYIGKYIANEGIFHYTLADNKGICDSMGNVLTNNIEKTQEKKEETKASLPQNPTGEASSEMITAAYSNTSLPQ